MSVARILVAGPIRIGRWLKRWGYYRTSTKAIGPGTKIGDGVVLFGGTGVCNDGIVIGANCHIYDCCRLVVDNAGPNSGISIGNNVAINYNCYIEGSGGIEIGDDTIIGPNVVILSSSHVIDKPDRLIRESGKIYARTVVGKNVWIGSNVCMVAGVEIGDGCVIGAGSVVTKSFPPHSVIVGAPARLLRTRQ